MIFDGKKCVTSQIVMSCSDGEYINSGLCQQCSTKFANCSLCTKERCLICSGDTLLSNDVCVFKEECTPTLSNKCICSSGEIYDGVSCANKITNCLFQVSLACVQCQENYVLYNGTCVTLDDTSNILEFTGCEETTPTGCLVCSEGYYNEIGICESCPIGCTTCLNAFTCLSCSSGLYLNEHQCNNNTELTGICLQFNMNGGCVKCADGYYREEFGCSKCSTGCKTCYTSSQCYLCDEYNFMTEENVCKLKSTITNCSTEISSQNGCSQCDDGYYNKNRQCYKCDLICKTCSSSDLCISCNDDHVYSSGSCLKLSQITDCVVVKGSKCTKCSFWKKPDTSGVYCKSSVVWWVIFLVVIFVLFMIITVLICIILAMNFFMKLARTREMKQNVHIFCMKKMGVQFVKNLNALIALNKPNIIFGDEEKIPINTETVENLCIGNVSKHTLKVQFVVTKNEKCVIRTQPELVILQKGFACEFQVFVNPLCSCKQNVLVKIVTLDLKTDSVLSNDFSLSYETQSQPGLTLTRFTKRE
ncbi:protein kinase domain containing protein, partial [Entamoeba invadens IP1]|uniref:protein kinase domain containing protein n=1 Tax=Entamoeba invadens IP1 TaxID=370355 RepID=UPI0002C3F9CB